MLQCFLDHRAPSLFRSGRLPRLVAVQSDGCAPLYRAFEEAKGIAGNRAAAAEAPASLFDDPNFSIERPKRLKEMLFAVESSGGAVVTVTEGELRAAQRALGRRGVYAELSAAAGLAAAQKFFPHGKPDNYRVIVPVTGSGFKR